MSDQKPSAEPFPSISSLLAKLAEIFKTLGIIIAPLLFLNEYHLKTELDKRQRSLEEVRLFRASPEYAEMEKRDLELVDGEFIARVKATAKRALESGSLCEYDAIWNGDNEKRRLVSKVTARIDVLAVCANSGLCRAEEICKTVGKKIHAYLSDNCTTTQLLENLWNRSLTREIRILLRSCREYGLKDETFCEAAAEARHATIDEMLRSCAIGNQPN